MVLFMAARLTRPRSKWLGPGLVIALAVLYRGVLRGDVLAGRDLFRLFIPDADFLRRTLLSGTLPLWNPWVRLGEPFAATLQSQVFYPPNVIAVLLFGATRGPTVLHLFHAALAAAGMFLAVRGFGRTRAAAALSASVFALSPFFSQASGVPNIAGALAWAGWVLLGVQAISRRGTLGSAFRLALPLALSALCGAPETTLVLALIALALSGAGGRPRRTFGLALLGCVWAMAVAAVALLPAAELLRHSTRALGEQGLSWSASVPQVLSAFLPFADLPAGAYWGQDQTLFFSLFLGSTSLWLSLLALGGGRRARVLAGLAVLFLLLSLGAHFGPARLLLTRTPLAIFRYPVKAFAGVAIAASLLAGFGLDRLGARARQSRLPVRWVVPVALVVLSVGFPLLTHLPVRRGIALGFLWAWATAFVLALAFALVPEGHRRARIIRIVAASLLALELVFFALRFPVKGWAPASRLDAPSVSAQALEGKLEPTQRLSVVLPDTPPPEEPISPRDYLSAARDGLVPMQALRDSLATVEGYAPPPPALGHGWEKGAPRSVYDLLGVKAFVRAGGPAVQGLTEVAHVQGVSRTYVGGHPLPRAFMVYRTQQATSAQARAAVEDPKEPFRTVAFVEKPLALPETTCTGPTPAQVQEVPNRVEVEADACGAGVLVLADRDYPGWKATVDGAPRPIFRVDHLLRGVQVPSGRHTVVFVYRPVSVALGGALSLLALLAGLFAWRRPGP
jgi:hypothetical protein